MKVLIDVNFGASWAGELRARGIEAVYWAAVGLRTAVDDDLVQWSRSRDHVLHTQDLGIASRLKRSGAKRPSVIQVRHVDDLNRASIDDVAAACRKHAAALDAGAIVVLDARTGRSRVRPL